MSWQANFFWNFGKFIELEILDLCIFNIHNFLTIYNNIHKISENNEGWKNFNLLPLFMISQLLKKYIKFLRNLLKR